MQADIFRTIQQMQHLYFRLCGMAARVVVKDCDMTMLVAEWQDTFITRVVIATVEDYMTDYHVKLESEFGLIVAGLILEGVGASLWRVFALYSGRVRQVSEAACFGVCCVMCLCARTVSKYMKQCVTHVKALASKPEKVIRDSIAADMALLLDSFRQWLEITDVLVTMEVVRVLLPHALATEAANITAVVEIAQSICGSVVKVRSPPGCMHAHGRRKTCVQPAHEVSRYCVCRRPTC